MSWDTVPGRNGEGYPDPTASTALARVQHSQKGLQSKLCRFLQMGKRPEYDQQQAEQRAVYRFQLNEWNHFHHEFGTQLRTQHSVG